MALREGSDRKIREKPDMRARALAWGTLSPLAPSAHRAAPEHVVGWLKLDTERSGLLR